jgi:hypothetical protein
MTTALRLTGAFGADRFRAAAAVAGSSVQPDTITRNVAEHSA